MTNLKINSTLEFNIKCSSLCGKMVSLHFETKKEAAKEASDFLKTLPKFISNNPNNFNEIKSLNTLILKNT